jgi:phosphate:Na+ symporter
MSEGLQKVAGNNLRSALASMTKNSFMGVLTGVFITALIQSSSATTVMVVSFVNAGLLTLLQSVTVIMGANIGTTVTAWIISLFGFKVSIAAFSLPMIAVAIPFIFSGKSKRKSIGEFILGFAFLFMGLEMLKDSVPDLKSNPEMLSFLSNYTQSGFGSVLIFLLIGTILTIVVQSSSATMAITLVMVSKGWVPYELGAAMVLGENIGTTITANIAAIPANVSAKRAALAHTTFNIFGVIWMLFLFYPFLNMITQLVSNYGPGNPTQLTEFTQKIDAHSLNMITSNSDSLTPGQLILQGQLLNYQVATSFGLALFHTMFNLINTFVMIWFAKPIAKIVTFVVKKKATDEEFQLQYIFTGLLSTSELSLLQAWKELNHYADRTQKMFKLTRDLYYEQNENEFIKIYTRVQKYESISDRMELEIAKYLTKVSDGRLSEEGKRQIQTMLRVVSEIESVSDGCNNIARTIVRKRDDKAAYTADMDANIDLMFNLTEGAIFHMCESMEENNLITRDQFNRAVNIEMEINNFRNQLKLQNIADVKDNIYSYQASITYMDIIVECEKTGDYIINVIEALNESSMNA